MIFVLSMGGWSDQHHLPVVASELYPGWHHPLSSVIYCCCLQALFSALAKKESCRIQREDQTFESSASKEKTRLLRVQPPKRRPDFWEFSLQREDQTFESSASKEKTRLLRDHPSFQATVLKLCWSIGWALIEVSFFFFFFCKDFSLSPVLGLSLSLSLSSSFSVSVTLSLSLSICVCLSHSHSLFLSPSLPFSHSASFCLCLSVCFSLCLSHSVCLSVSLSLSHHDTSHVTTKQYCKYNTSVNIQNAL